MRKWGVVITVVYALIVLGLLTPGAILMVGGDYAKWGELAGNVWGTYTSWLFWVFFGVVLCGEALLLFLSVDTSRQRLKPRAHILVSCTVAAALTAMLTAAAIWSVVLAANGDAFMDSGVAFVCFLAGLWLLWGIVFYLFLRNSSAVVTRIVSWLLRGSVLELLIVVPCHIIVRRRNDCSAPVATSFGIATGIAIMLLSFGPSVLLLYKKRLDEYARRGAA
ncbi:MAG: hypothetical protein ACLP1Y_13490 [Candidatus Acidiferrales bacterium]